MVIEYYPKEGAFSYNNGDPDNNITIEGDATRMIIYGYNGAMSANFPFCKPTLKVIERLYDIMQKRYYNFRYGGIHYDPTIRYGYMKHTIAAYNARDADLVYSFLKGLWEYLSDANEKGLLPEEAEKGIVEEIENPWLNDEL